MNNFEKIKSYTALELANFLCMFHRIITNKINTQIGAEFIVNEPDSDMIKVYLEWLNSEVINE